MKFFGFLKSIFLPALCANFLFANILIFHDVFSQDIFLEHEFVDSIGAHIYSVLYYVLFGMHASYILIIFFAWPMYWLGNRFFVVNFSGVIVTAILFVVFPCLLFINGFTFKSIFSGDNFWAAIALAFTGLLSGIMFWRNINKHM